MTGRALSALAVAVVLSAPPASAGVTDPVFAQAAFGVVGNAHVGYVVRFTVRRDFASSVARTELVSEAYRCSFASAQCDLVSQQIDALPDAAFVTRPDQTATLRTRWAGWPLVVDWRRGGRAQGSASGHSTTYLNENHVETMIEYRTMWSRATASALLGGGRDCSDRLAVTIAATAAAAEDALMQANDLPRAETVRGLASSHGRCYRTA